MFTSQYQGFQAQPIGAATNDISSQGNDLSTIVNSVAQNAAQALPGLLMSLLSAHPQIQQIARQGQGGLIGGAYNQFGANPQNQSGGNQQNQFGQQPQLGVNTQYGAAGIASQGQGVDLGTIINSIAQSAAQALPGLLTSLLSAHPQFQHIARQGAWGNLQNQYGFGAGTQQFGGLNMFTGRPQFGGLQNAGLQQGSDLGTIVNAVAHSAAHALPGLIMSLLSTHPQFQHIARQSAWGNQQSQYGFGANTPFGGGGLNIFDNRPQFAGQQNVGGSAQGFDLGNIVNSVAQSAAQALPGLLTSLLSAHPQFQHIARQGGLSAQNQFGSNSQNQFGANQQGQFGLGAQNQNQFGLNPHNQFGANQQGQYGLNPQNQFGQNAQNQFGQGVNTSLGAAGTASQGFDLGSLAQNVAGIISPQIPAIVNSVMGQVLGGQQTLH